LRERRKIKEKRERGGRELKKDIWRMEDDENDQT
jgi:hypothetical protein